jgi:hypothetical protein
MNAKNIKALLYDDVMNGWAAPSFINFLRRSWSVTLQSFCQREMQA